MTSDSLLKIEQVGPVVIVDDDMAALRIAEAVFKESKVRNELILFSGGRELLSYLSDVTTGDAKMPALILLDLSMPAPNGHETLQAIRANDSFKAKPIIIILTGSKDENDRTKALEAGANGYEIKPFEFEDFVGFANSLVVTNS